MAEHFPFDCNGVPRMLNGHFIGRMGIDGEGCARLANLHRIKASHLSVMEACSKFERRRLHKIYDTVRTIEYMLQSEWGFSLDSNWHRHWEVPHCTCYVKMNLCVYPHQSIFNDSCPVHGA